MSHFKATQKNRNDVHEIASESFCQEQRTSAIKTISERDTKRRKRKEEIPLTADLAKKKQRKCTTNRRLTKSPATNDVQIKKYRTITRDDHSLGNRSGSSEIITVLEHWFLEHLPHPYPAVEDQNELMRETGMNEEQIKNW
eukprot:CAMPEP_0195515160 /NCGR_PEP_ID=MMETSP0794_2-20130614/6328_1 /TAXON_ID=515487 /ORGANISM="Stephanopyxis turris, Strain CCMP 815" /LENGTH=140 /DNA_ID=CAMNT_0040643543 /DNA_START=106 /DNA_END=525 /DNA_ORIENTATION=+